MHKQLGIVLISIFTTITFAQETKKVAINDTKQIMHQALDSIVHLFPYMSSELKFKDPKYEKEINLHLNKIAHAFKSAKHIKDFQSPGFAPNYRIIKEHLDDTILSFTTHNKTFARLRLASTTSLCLSCHTQLPKDKMTTFILDNKKVNRETFENEFEYGNFLFLLRQYKKAIRTYEASIEERLAKQVEMKKIQKILGSGSDQFDRTLFNSFQRILTIYSKVLKQPREAIALLSKYQSNKEIPKYMQREIAEWIKELKNWVGKKEIEHKIANDEEMKSFIYKYIAKLENDTDSINTGLHDVDLLLTSGVVSNYLADHPSTVLAPEILYWLGLSENRLTKNLFFTLGDLYLKECVIRYPKNPVAIKCFNEYENEVNFRFTGSIGTNIPKSKVKELNYLKSLIK
jgi:hypothetical protein